MKTENKGPRNPIKIKIKKIIKKKPRKQYEQQCQSHTCSGTIDSGMHDHDFSITTFPLTSSAPYSA